MTKRVTAADRRIAAIKSILVKNYDLTVSYKAIADMIDGNPMIYPDTKVVDIAQMIAGHLQDERS
jgi:hypothetical protein